jgi:hypothetical protein
MDGRSVPRLALQGRARTLLGIFRETLEKAGFADICAGCVSSAEISRLESAGFAESSCVWVGKSKSTARVGFTRDRKSKPGNRLQPAFVLAGGGPSDHQERKCPLQI